MDEREQLLTATARMEQSLAEAQRVTALLDAERAQVVKVRRIQKLWWWALFLLGAGLGFMVAEALIDPVTIIVPAEGIEV